MEIRVDNVLSKKGESGRVLNEKLYPYFKDYRRALVMKQCLINNLNFDNIDITDNNLGTQVKVILAKDVVYDVFMSLDNCMTANSVKNNNYNILRDTLYKITKSRTIFCKTKSLELSSQDLIKLLQERLVNFCKLSYGKGKHFDVDIMEIKNRLTITIFGDKEFLYEKQFDTVCEDYRESFGIDRIINKFLNELYILNNTYNSVSKLSVILQHILDSYESKYKVHCSDDNDRLNVYLDDTDNNTFHLFRVDKLNFKIETVNKYLYKKLDSKLRCNLRLYLRSHMYEMK